MVVCWVQNPIKICKSETQNALEHAVVERSLKSLSKIHSQEWCQRKLISRVRLLLHDFSYKESFTMKWYYSVTTTHYQVRLMPCRKHCNNNAFNLCAVTMPQKYFAPLRLDPEKIKDLEDLLACTSTSVCAQYLIYIIQEQRPWQEREWPWQGPKLSCFWGKWGRLYCRLRLSLTPCDTLRSLALIRGLLLVKVGIISAKLANHVWVHIFFALFIVYWFYYQH